jgi:hypothetical protein
MVKIPVSTSESYTTTLVHIWLIRSFVVPPDPTDLQHHIPYPSNGGDVSTKTMLRLSLAKGTMRFATTKLFEVPLQRLTMSRLLRYQTSQMAAPHHRPKLE